MIRDTKIFAVPQIWKDRFKKGLCPACGKNKSEFEKSRKVYCSKECAYKSQDFCISYQTIRNKFRSKHADCCDKCGLKDLEVLENYNKEKIELFNQLVIKYKNEILTEKLRLIADCENHFNYMLKSIENVNFENQLWKSKLQEWENDKNLFPRYRPRFEVDHIIAIVNGGDQWDKNNLQLLCNKIS